MSAGASVFLWVCGCFRPWRHSRQPFAVIAFCVRTFVEFVVDLADVDVDGGLGCSLICGFSLRSLRLSVSCMRACFSLILPPSLLLLLPLLLHLHLLHHRLLLRERVISVGWSAAGVGEGHVSVFAYLDRECFCIFAYAAHM